MKEKYPNIHFKHYADDVVVHCRPHKQAKWIKRKLERRLELCSLTVHPEKTKILYCKDSRRGETWACTSFDFLGFTFRPRSSRNYKGELFVSFSPAISRKATKRLRQTIRRSLKLTSRALMDIQEIARRLNPVIRVWINYYGSFCRSALHPVLHYINTSLIG